MTVRSEGQVGSLFDYIFILQCIILKMNQRIASYIVALYLFFTSIIPGKGISIGNSAQDLTSCSKFHFEEKVLEKLVRIEHYIELNEMKMKNWEEKIKTKLKLIDEDFLENVEQWEKQFSAKLKYFNETNLEKAEQLDIEIQTKLMSIDRKFKNRTDELQLLQEQLTGGISKHESLMAAVVVNFTTLSTILSEDQRVALEAIGNTTIMINDLEKRRNNTFQTAIKRIHDNLEFINHTVHHALDRMTSNSTIMSKELSDLQAQANITQFTYLQSFMDKLNTSLVLFQAWKVSPDTDLEGQVIIFPEVSTNIGHGYDKTTGYFTAPISGVYIFTLQICSEKDKPVSMEILARGKAIANLYSYQNFRDFPCISTTGFASLLKDDKAWIMCRTAESGDSVFNHITNGNFFTGLLIHK